MRLNGGGKERKEMAALLTTRFDHCQHRLDKTTAAGTLHAKRQLAPNHRVTQRPLARVVRRLHPATSSERPKPATMFVQLPTRALHLTVAAGQAAAQQPFDFAPHRSQPALHRRPANRGVAIVGPMAKERFRRAPQVVAEPLGLSVATVDHRLKIPNQDAPSTIAAGRVANTSSLGRR